MNNGVQPELALNQTVPATQRDRLKALFQETISVIKNLKISNQPEMSGVLAEIHKLIDDRVNLTIHSSFSSKSLEARVEFILGQLFEHLIEQKRINPELSFDKFLKSLTDSIRSEIAKVQRAREDAVALEALEALQASPDQLQRLSSPSDTVLSEKDTAIEGGAHSAIEASTLYRSLSADISTYYRNETSRDNAWQGFSTKLGACLGSTDAPSDKFTAALILANAINIFFKLRTSRMSPKDIEGRRDDIVKVVLDDLKTNLINFITQTRQGAEQKSMNFLCDAIDQIHVTNFVDALRGCCDMKSLKKSLANSKGFAASSTGEAVEHTKLYRGLFASISREYHSPEARKQHSAWKGFAQELGSADADKNSTGNVIANIINVFYKLRTNGLTDAQKTEQNPNIIQEILHDLKINLAKYITKMRFNEKEKAKSFLCEAMDTINDQSFLEDLRSCVDINKFRTTFRNFDLDSVQAGQGAIADISSAAVGAAAPSGFIAATSTNTRRIGGPATDGKSNTNVELGINEDFRSLGRLYPSQMPFVTELAKNLKKEDFDSENPLENKIPPRIIVCLTIAADRELKKTQNPIPNELQCLTHFNEMEEYLKTLANALNYCPELNSLCEKLQLKISPAQLVLTQIFLEYFTTNSDKQDIYLKTLENLDSLTQFRGIKSMIEQIQARRSHRAEEELSARLKNEALEILSDRNSRNLELLDSLEKGPIAVARVDSDHLGKPNNREVSRLNEEGFWKRLLLQNFADPKTLFLLDQNQEGAIQEIFYLVTGRMLLSPLKSEELKVFNPEKAELLTLDFNGFLSIFHKGVTTLRAAFHTDGNRPSFIKNLGLRFNKNKLLLCQNLEKACLEFADSVEHLADSGSGWENEKFGKMISSIRGPLEDSGLASLINTEAQSPAFNQEITNDVRKLQENQNTTINLLSKIWASLSGSAQSSQATREIEAGLNALSA